MKVSCLLEGFKKNLIHDFLDQSLTFRDTFEIIPVGRIVLSVHEWEGLSSLKTLTRLPTSQFLINKTKVDLPANPQCDQLMTAESKTQTVIKRC